MPRAKQHHAHKGAAHSQRVGNFVVTHVRVIAHHQRHARPRAHFFERLPHFLARALLDQFFELAWFGMLERHAFHVFAGRHGPPTETEDRRSIFPVKLAPSLRVARPGTGNRLGRLAYSRRAHPAWSLRFHSLVRTKACKYYTFECPAILVLHSNPFISMYLWPHSRPSLPFGAILLAALTVSCLLRPWSWSCSWFVILKRGKSRCAFHAQGNPS